MNGAIAGAVLQTLKSWCGFHRLPSALTFTRKLHTLIDIHFAECLGFPEY